MFCSSIFKDNSKSKVSCISVLFVNLSRKDLRVGSLDLVGDEDKQYTCTVNRVDRMKDVQTGESKRKREKAGSKLKLYENCVS